MATMDDLDELALAMPQTTKSVSDDGRVDYAVGSKTFCRHREPRGDALDSVTGERLLDVLMFRTEHLDARDILLEDSRGAYFITDHFTGYPAILVRIRDLPELTRDDLDDLVARAWLACAGKRVAKAWLAEQKSSSTEHRSNASDE